MYSVVVKDPMIMGKIASTQIPTSLQCWCVSSDPTITPPPLMFEQR